MLDELEIVMLMYLRVVLYENIGIVAAFEAVLGFLYETGQQDRLNELMKEAYSITLRRTFTWIIIL